MAVTTTQTNKPFNPRGNDQSPKGYNRAALYSGKALDFDGVNDYVEVPYLDSLANTGVSSTFSFYFNADALTGTMVFAEQRKDTSNRYVVWYDHAYNRIQLYMNSGVKNINFSLTETGQWFYFTGVVDGSTAKMYINGELIGSTSYVPFESNVDFYLGTYNGASGLFYSGKMSNAKVFDVALTAAQVADLYNNPEKVVPTGVDNTALKLWLPMQEGAGTTAYDGSGNGNHGTISGATYVHGIGAPVSQTAVIDWNKGTNLVAYSEDLENSDWTKQNGIAVTANQAISPDGYTNADLIYGATSGSISSVQQNLGAASVATYTNSIFVKYSGKQWFYIFELNGNSGGNFFDIQNGVKGVQNFGSDSFITSYGNGWYKVGFTQSLTSGNLYSIYGVSNANDSFTNTADGTNGALIWGASLEQSATAGPYVRTGATAQTSPVLLPQGLTSGRDITGVNLFENVRKQGALNLDGNSWAEVHDNASLDITDAITLEAWVYWNGSTAKGLLGRWKGAGSLKSYLLFANTTTAAQFLISNNGSANYAISTSTSISIGWNHIVGTADGSKVKIYLNGAFENEAAAAVSIYTTNLPVEIGRLSDGGNVFDDQIAQPRIYNRALTAEEVQRSYDSGKNIFTNS